MPFLSLIIPVYNADKYLEACFDSIKCQTFQDYEVIIVDDGSTDKSPLICDQYSVEDARVQVFHVENGGPSRARNIGFKKASGQYIYCIDNDDYFTDKEYFSKIHQLLLKNPVDVLQTGATYYRENEKCVSVRVEYRNVPKVDIEKPYDTIFWLVSHRLYETSCWSKVIRREFLVGNDYYFNQNLLVEDLDWNMRFLQNIRSYNILKCSSYIHVFRAGSITSSKGERSYKSCLDQIATIETWGRYYESYKKNDLLRLSVLSFLGYQYFITLAKCATLTKEYKKEVEAKLKEIEFITEYAIERKQKYLRSLYKILGFKLTMTFLELYYTKLRWLFKKR